MLENPKWKALLLLALLLVVASFTFAQFNRLAAPAVGVHGYWGSNTSWQPIAVSSFRGTTLGTYSLTVALQGRTFSDLSRNLTGVGTTVFEFTSANAELVEFNSCLVSIDVAAGTGTTPSLATYFQVSVDGTNWQDRISFAAVTTVASRQEAAVTSSSSPVTAFTDGTLAASTIRDGNFPGRARVKYVVTGTSPVFNPVNARVVCK